MAGINVSHGKVPFSTDDLAQQIEKDRAKSAKTKVRYNGNQ